MEIAGLGSNLASGAYSWSKEEERDESVFDSWAILDSILKGNVHVCFEKQIM